jgi:hypothetical protein
VPIPNNQAVKANIAKALKSYKDQKVLKNPPKSGVDYWLSDSETLIVKLPKEGGETHYAYWRVSKKESRHIGGDTFDAKGLLSGFEYLGNQRTLDCSRLKDGSYHVGVTRAVRDSRGMTMYYFEPSLAVGHWPRDRSKPPHP